MDIEPLEFLMAIRLLGFGWAGMMNMRDILIDYLTLTRC